MGDALYTGHYVTQWSSEWVRWFWFGRSSLVVFVLSRKNQSRLNDRPKGSQELVNRVGITDYKYSFVRRKRFL
jgi:hypothetical protein